MKNMNKLLILPFLIFSYSAQADSLNEASLLLQEEFSQSQPGRYTKYTLETEDLKVLIFKMNYEEPPLNPYFFNIYFQCKSNNIFYKLNRIFNNSNNESVSYCGHNSFHIGSIQNEGSSEFLILPMKRDKNHSCPSTPNDIEVFPINEMKEKCT